MTHPLGLTTSEALERQRQGLGNKVDLRTSRSVGEIFVANFLNIANVILLAIVVVLVAVGKPADALVTGGVVIINVLIGSVQEFRSKRQLDRIALLTRPRVTALRDGKPTEINQADVVVGDVLILKAGDQAVVDGKMLADPNKAESLQRVEMDESALTGESDLIPKRPGDDILSGSFVVVGECLYVAEKVGNESFAQKITAGARQYTRVVTPLQEQISILVRVLVVLAIALSLMLALAYAYQEKPFSDGVEDVAVVISLVPQGLLLMITVAYALGAVRIARKGALVQQMNAVESLSNVDVLCMDKTGTLTTNRILFDALHPLPEVGEARFRAALGDFVASSSAKNRTAEAIATAVTGSARPLVAEIPFSSTRKWSAASFEEGSFVLGAPEMILPNLANGDSAALQRQVDDLANHGLRVLLFAHSPQGIENSPDHNRDYTLPGELAPLGLVSFSDELRPNVKEVLAGFRQAQIKLKLISGDNPTTVAALAYQAGFSPAEDKAISGVELADMTPEAFQRAVRERSIFGRITPQQKSAIVDVLRGDGHYVAMIGDGVNDVLSLKKAQVGIAMEDGSQATRSVADIVLLGNKFEILPQAFLEGQRILNGMNDSARLFLTRTLYAALLIIIAGFIGSQFPFTPRHNALLTSLPVGIPAFFLAYWAKTGQPKKTLLVSVTEFVFPAGFSLMLVMVFLWVLYLTYGDASVEKGRSVLTTAALLGGLWVIILAQYERETWQDNKLKRGDLRRVWLVLVMFGLFLVIMAVPSLREFFELTPLSPADIATIAAAMTVWGIGLYLLWRFDVLERLLIPNYQRNKRIIG